MIFLTVGSHEPFDRLVAAADAFAADHPDIRVFGQITARAGYRPRHFEWVETLDPAAYRKACDDTEVFLAHAGMGSIITALQIARPIVVMPRRGHLNETRNDHQYDTALKLRDKPGIFLAEDETGIAAAIDAARSALVAAAQGAPELSPHAEDRLIAFLRRVGG